jgi:hypothetical protein
LLFVMTLHACHAGRFGFRLRPVTFRSAIRALKANGNGQLLVTDSLSQADYLQRLAHEEGCNLHRCKQLAGGWELRIENGRKKRHCRHVACLQDGSQFRGG